MDERKPFWFAKQLGGGDFRLTDASTLGGVSIKPMTGMPSVAPRDDGTGPVVFAFYPCDRGNIVWQRELDMVDSFIAQLNRFVQGGVVKTLLLGGTVRKAISNVTSRTRRYDRKAAP